LKAASDKGFRQLEKFMKTTLILFCLLCTATAFGQAFGGALSTEPIIIQPVTHPQHASQLPMLQEQSLYYVSTSVITAHGERPLWEFATQTREVPLGDLARLFREGHEDKRKANKVWENQ